EERLLLTAVEGERQVILLRDLGGTLDPEPADDVAADVQPQDLSRAGLGLAGRGGELDAARLATATRQHLRLDDDGAAEVGGGPSGLGRADREAALRYGDAEALEQLLALALVEGHPPRAGGEPGAP